MPGNGNRDTWRHCCKAVEPHHVMQRVINFFLFYCLIKLPSTHFIQPKCILMQQGVLLLSQLQVCLFRWVGRRVWVTLKPLCRININFMMVKLDCKPDIYGIRVKGAKTLKTSSNFQNNPKAAPLNDTPTEAGIDGACHLVKLFQLHPMTDTRKQVETR